MAERWSDNRQIKEVLERYEKGKNSGFVLRTERDGIWLSAGAENMNIVGITGCGKTQFALIPSIYTCLQNGENIICTDPKGEIFEATACYAAQTHRVLVLNLRDMTKSNHFNPLRAPLENFRSQDPLRIQRGCDGFFDIAAGLVPRDTTSDAYWTDSARTLITAACQFLAETAPEERVDFSSVHQFISRARDRCGAQTVLHALLETLPKDSSIAAQLRSTADTARDTAWGTLSTALESIAPLCRSPLASELLASDDFHINDLDCDTPVAVYVILPDESAPESYSAIGAAALNQLMSHYIRLAQDRYHGRLPRRTTVVLDELGNIGKSIESLDRLMTTCRSRNMRICTVLQAYSQLDSLYGTSKAATILSNAGITLAFRTSDQATLEMLSKRCGDRERVYDGEAAIREPLITATQLGCMQTGQALAISGRTKFITQLKHYSEVFDWSDWTPPVYPETHLKGRIPVFDVMQFIKEVEVRRKVDLCEQIKTSDYNIRELVRKIDEKIEALQEEEKTETAAEKQGNQNSPAAEADSKEKFRGIPDHSLEGVFDDYHIHGNFSRFNEELATFLKNMPRTRSSAKKILHAMGMYDCIQLYQTLLCGGFQSFLKRDEHEKAVRDYYQKFTLPLPSSAEEFEGDVGA